MELQPGETVLTLSPHERAPFVPGEEPVLTTHRLLRLTPRGDVAQSLRLDEIAACEISTRLPPLSWALSPRRLARPVGLLAVPPLLFWAGGGREMGLVALVGILVPSLWAMWHALDGFDEQLGPRLCLTVTDRSGEAVLFPSRTDSAGDLALFVYRVEEARQRRLATGAAPSDAPRPARTVMLFPEETPLPLSDDEVELLGGRRSLVLTSHRVRIYVRDIAETQIRSMPLEEVASVALERPPWRLGPRNPWGNVPIAVGAVLPALFLRMTPELETPPVVLAGITAIFALVLMLPLSEGIFSRGTGRITFTSTSGVRAELPTHATPEELAPLVRRIQAAWHARREARGVP